MMSAGKLMGQDLLQMVNAGFNPLNEISKTTGKSMAELKKEMSKGAISAQMVSDAFKSATSSGGLFSGLLEKQSRTTLGKWSTLMGKLELTAVNMSDAFLPIINKGLDALIPSLDRFNSLITTLNNTRKSIQAWATDTQVSTKIARDEFKLLNGVLTKTTKRYEKLHPKSKIVSPSRFFGEIFGNNYKSKLLPKQEPQTQGVLLPSGLPSWMQVFKPYKIDDKKTKTSSVADDLNKSIKEIITGGRKQTILNVNIGTLGEFKDITFNEIEKTDLAIIEDAIKKTLVSAVGGMTNIARTV